MSITWVNKTNKTVVLVNDEDVQIKLAPTPPTIYIPIEYKEKGSGPGDVIVLVASYGETVNLPEQFQGIQYIVPRIVATAHPERKDFYVVSDIDLQNTNRKILYGYALSRMIPRKEWLAYESRNDDYKCTDYTSSSKTPQKRKRS